jgi:Spy/CpxP family protein refolding chaperone
MKGMRSLAIWTIFVFALSAPAQQAATNSGSHEVPSVEGHLKVLATKLDLTADQQYKVRPILQEMHDSMQKVEDDQTLSHDERMADLRPIHSKADKEIREVLNDDQKKKLDLLEQQSHADFHGNPGAAKPAPSQSPEQ